MSVANAYLPVSAAYCGGCCANCCSSPDKLLKCTRCKLAFYCTKECQLADFAKHKVECKLLKLLKEGYSDIPGSDCQRQAKALNFLTALPLYLSSSMNDIPNKKKEFPTMAQVKTLKKDRFVKFAMCSRACSICLCNEFTPPRQGENKLDWKCCPHCHFGWCCGPDHWDQYKDRHTPEICRAYQRSAKMELFHYRHAKGHNEVLLHMPQEGLTSALDTFPDNWESYFRLRFKETYQKLIHRLPPEFFPASTRLLSQPVTCLAAMYKSGISHFCNLKELTLHVVGAGSFEVPATCVWEEIMHCIPQLRVLTVQFIGPEACKSVKEGTKDLSALEIACCPKCTAQGRKRLTGMFGYTYHDYAQKYLKTSQHAKPDFIVAFNTGMHEVDTESWKTTLEVMLDMNVPAYFTSYSKEEAKQDFEVLRSVNANLLQETAERNPFAEDHMQIEPPSAENGVDKFFSNNMYGVLFQGRRDNKQ